MNLKDDYSKISNFALEEKKGQTLDKWIKAKLPTYYVMIDPGTAEECPQLKKFDAEKKSF